jgi:hypothetical protein
VDHSGCHSYVLNMFWEERQSVRNRSLIIEMVWIFFETGALVNNTLFTFHLRTGLAN